MYHFRKQFARKGNKVTAKLGTNTVLKKIIKKMFLEKEAAFLYCNWSIKMARIIWFGSTSVDIGPVSRLSFLPNTLKRSLPCVTV